MADDETGDKPENPKSKSIVLCSDGTGNSGGKGRGTNVWRMYQAIDLSDGTQVAFHDDGVGTQDNKILRAIGGATGFGLSRNIRELYASLVRVYNHGDRVYAFGFSRGAYTIRSLVNFIHEFGVLDRHAFNTPDELESEIARLYRAYRKKKSFEDVASDRRHLFWERAPRVIEFLGVWDTVDAIGVPFDELREIIRRFFSRHHAHDLNESIKAACHALSIDDERRSFRPTLFTQANGRDGTQVVEQVWFSGVHSNIGGGYPKDELAFISLVWMMRHASDPALFDGFVPLKFHAGALKQYADAANPYGKMYDSRAGAAAYYRLSPRDIGKLCRKAGAGDPKIHASAMMRISNRTDGYAPFNIPDRYEVVDGGSAHSSPLCRPQSATLGDNAKFLRWAWNFSGWRRRLYDAFLITTFLFVAVVASQMSFHRDAELPRLRSIFAGAVKAITPDFMAGAVDAAFMRIGWLVVFAGIFALLFWARGLLKRVIRDLSGIGWRAVYLAAVLQVPSGNGDPEKMEKRHHQMDLFNETKALVQRSSRSAIRWAFRKVGAFKCGSGALAIALVVLGVYLVGWHHPATDWTTACSTPGHATPQPDGRWYVTQFRPSDPCYRTGIGMTKDRLYAFDISTENWFDRTIPAGPGGFKDPKDADTWVMRLWKPFLREEEQGYFVLMGQIVGPAASGTDADPTRVVALSNPFPIGNADQPIRAPASGELVLFVNDVLCPLCPSGTFLLYSNNKGRAVIRIREKCSKGKSGLSGEKC